MQQQSLTSKILLYLAWLQSLAALLGSLYYSEIKHYNPCTLCWYQRILMYPLVVLIAVGIIRRDRYIYVYVLPLSILGTLLALYHTLLQKGFLPERIAPCTLGASCTTKYVGYLGFITIPVMSLTAFAVITICMILLYKHNKKTLSETN